MSLWLAIDVSYLAWRAHYTTGTLTNGVAFGVLREIRSLCGRFVPSKVCFAFDIGRSKRAKLYPDYKRRGIRTEEQQLANLQVSDAIDSLRQNHLPALGFTNFFYQSGYEADDIIASIVHNRESKTQEVVIVSADHDLYQLLDDEETVGIWQPNKKRMLTGRSFELLYGISCHSWPTVKAIAGCKSDNIRGVIGVGEKTAIKYLNAVGTYISKKPKVFQKIEEDWDDVLERLKLVKLPFEGTNLCIPNGKDKVTDRKWNDLYERLGFKSLLERSK